MKTTFFTLALIIGLSVSQFTQAQKFDDIYKKYQTVPGIQAMKFNDVGPLIGSALNNQDPEIKELAKKTNSVRILINKQFLEDLNKDLNNYVKKNKLDELMSYTGEGNNIGIYMVEKKEIINEIVVSVATSDGNHIVLQVLGEYPLKTVQDLISKNSDKLNFKF